MMSQENIENNNKISLFSEEIYYSIFNSVYEYMQSFQSQDEDIQLNYLLKKEHTTRVIGYSEQIANSLKCEHEKVLIAKLIALLHDVGRFEQFKNHQTFNDNLSEDHAALGVTIINEKGWLISLGADLSQLILNVIVNHNKLSIGKNESENVVFFSKIIRDADKIDIYEIAVHVYNTANKKKIKSFTLDLADSLKISAPVIKSIMNEKLPDKKDLKTVTDFKLMQLAYVYDFNFKISYTIINQRQYIKQIFDTLPKSDQVFEIYRKAKIHVENQLLNK